MSAAVTSRRWPQSAGEGAGQPSNRIFERHRHPPGGVRVDLHQLVVGRDVVADQDQHADQVQRGAGDLPDGRRVTLVLEPRDHHQHAHDAGAEQHQHQQRVARGGIVDGVHRADCVRRR